MLDNLSMQTPDDRGEFSIGGLVAGRCARIGPAAPSPGRRSRTGQAECQALGAPPTIATYRGGCCESRYVMGDAAVFANLAAAISVWGGFEGRVEQLGTKPD
jgi:hypothetical protein